MPTWRRLRAAFGRSTRRWSPRACLQGEAGGRQREGCGALSADPELPKAGSVTTENRDEVQAAVDAIRGAMTETEERLLQWAGASVLEKLEVVEAALAKLDGDAADKAAAAKVTEAISAPARSR